MALPRPFCSMCYETDEPENRRVTEGILPFTVCVRFQVLEDGIKWATQHFGPPFHIHDLRENTNSGWLLRGTPYWDFWVEPTKNGRSTFFFKHSVDAALFKLTFLLHLTQDGK